MHEEALLVPGQRQLMYVTEPQLEQVIADAGRAVLACLQTNNADSSSTAGAAVGTPKLLSPVRGSWALAASVGGVQRLPGSSRALIRLLVTDRVAVQVGGVRWGRLLAIWARALSRQQQDAVLASALWSHVAVVPL